MNTYLLLAAAWLAANTIGAWATVRWAGLTHPRPWPFLWRFWALSATCVIIWLAVLVVGAYDAIRDRSKA